MRKAMGPFSQRMWQLFSRAAFGRGAAMLGDAAIVMESFAVALLFRFNVAVESEFWRMFWSFAIFAVLAFVVLLYPNGAYQSEVYQSTMGEPRL